MSVQEPLGVPGTPPVAPEAVCGATRGQCGVSERLRAAADLIEQRAAVTSVKYPPPWSAVDDDPGYLDAWRINCGTPESRSGLPDAQWFVDEGLSEEFALWATLLGPQVAPRLARVLREHAATLDACADLCGHPVPSDDDEVVALADVLIDGSRR